MELKNGAVIENATDAVYTIKKDADGNPDWTTTGGIVRINNATFRNCNNGVNFQYYHNFNPSNPSVETDNLSYVRNCTFETTRPLYDADQIPYCHIGMYEVKNIPVNNCIFRNTRTDLTSAAQRGCGIIATDASFNLSPSCSQSIAPCPEIYMLKNTFTGLEYAVKQINTNTLHPATIQYNVFQNNQYGILLSGVTGTTVNKNNFTITDNLAYGLYLNRCNAWHCEANTLTGPGNSSVNTFGIIVNNTFTPINEIYNNSFSNLKVGIESLGSNRGKPRESGVKIRCNDFTTCSKDIYITSEDPENPCSQYCGISPDQGANTSLSSPAGNTFSHTGPANQYTDIDNTFSTFPITYYRHSGTTGSWIPYYFRNTTLSATTYTYSKSTACPSQLGGGFTQLISSIASSESEIAARTTQLDALVDGGNTDALAQSVVSSQSQEAINLQNELLGVSPYVSDTVLAEAVKKEEVLNPVLLKEVMNANVHGIKSEKVQQAFDERVNPVPAYIMASIEQGKNSVSGKEVLEADIAMQHLYRKNKVNELVRYEMQKDQPDTLLQYAATSPDWDVKAVALFVNGSTSVQDLPDPAAYSYIAGIHHQIRNGKRFDQLSANEKLALKAISESGQGYAAVYALNMLIAANDTIYQEPIVVPMPEIELRNAALTSQTYMPEVSVYPNPAHDYFILDLVYPLDEKAVVDMIDSKGIVIRSQQILPGRQDATISTAGIDAGNYVVRITYASGETKALKLMLE